MKFPKLRTITGDIISSDLRSVHLLTNEVLIWNKVNLLLHSQPNSVLTSKGFDTILNNRNSTVRLLPCI